MDESTALPEVAPDLKALARDWVTLWQSELAAIASDREAQESWQAILALWAGAVGAFLAAAPRARPAASHSDERADRRTGTSAPQGAASASAAPDPRDAEIDRLASHVAELEARLAELERGLRRSGGSHRHGATGSGPRRRHG